MERFSRTERLIGAGKLEKLRGAKAALFGAGAVGSFAAEALVRSGIGSLVIVDFDDVHISNINRQIFALESTLGMPKVDVAKERLRDINPACKITAVNRFADADSIPEILTATPDIIIDAIDSIAPKVELLCYASANGIPVVSSMGAARRTDPLSVRTGDIFETSGCPLARQIRKALRKRGIEGGITAVYSAEQADPASHIDEQAEDGRGRTKILGSLPTVTGIFGLVAADTAIKIILGDY